MRYYMITKDSRYLDAYRQIKDMAVARFKFFKARIAEYGFDEMGMDDFGCPCYFFKLCPEGEHAARKGPEMAGFKGGERVYDNGAHYFKYTVKGRGKKLYDALVDGAPPVPDELKGGGRYGRQNIGTAFCAKLGLPDGVFSGNRILFGSCHMLHDDSTLVCSIPFREDDSVEAQPAVIPEGFDEITERAFQAEIKKHNDAIQGA